MVQEEEKGKDQRSPGALLRTGRESAGLSIEQVADKLHLLQSVLRIVDQGVGHAAHRAPGHVAVAVVAVDVVPSLLHRMWLRRLCPRLAIPRRRRTVHITPHTGLTRRGIHPAWTAH